MPAETTPPDTALGEELNNAKRIFDKLWNKGGAVKWSTATITAAIWIPSIVTGGYIGEVLLPTIPAGTVPAFACAAGLHTGLAIGYFIGQCLSAGAILKIQDLLAATDEIYKSTHSKHTALIKAGKEINIINLQHNISLATYGGIAFAACATARGAAFLLGTSNLPLMLTIGAVSTAFYFPVAKRLGATFYAGEMRYYAHQFLEKKTAVNKDNVTPAISPRQHIRKL